MIYIVEDDINIREIERYALKNSGFEVEEFDNGKDFFQRVSEQAPSLMLLDIMLPGEDGLEILGRVRKNPATEYLPGKAQPPGQALYACLFRSWGTLLFDSTSGVSAAGAWILVSIIRHSEKNCKSPCVKMHRRPHFVLRVHRLSPGGRSNQRRRSAMHLPRANTKNVADSPKIHDSFTYLHIFVHRHMVK